MRFSSLHSRWRCGSKLFCRFGENPRRWKIWLVGALVASTPAAAHPVVGAFERFYTTEVLDSAAGDGGMLLLNELNCVACHAAPAGWRQHLSGRGRIALSGVGARLSAETLGRFLRNPHELKPGTVMPQVAGIGDEESQALAAYLASLPSAEPSRAFPQGNRTRGRHLFESVGCVACHAPEAVPTTHLSVPLGLAAHSDHQALAAFLQDPLRSRPAGRMPATRLSDTEAADLAEYLGTGARVSPSSAATAVIARGRVLFAARNCQACHTVEGAEAVQAAPPLVSLRTDRGCLAPSPRSPAPHFHLNAEQVRALTTAVHTLQQASRPSMTTATQNLAARFEQLNCYACHEWRGRGGIEASRAGFFRASDSTADSLGELGRLPPQLDQAGRKLTPAWLESLLWRENGGVRPYLQVRMPRFGREAAGDLVAWLGKACLPEHPQIIDTSGEVGHQRTEIGRTLLGTGTGGLGCVSCHGIKDRQSNGIHAINLTQTAKRIRPEYFKALLLDPQHIQPGTIMPPLFVDRPNAAKEIESIWTYFKELDQSPRLPDGLELPGTFELKPAIEGRSIVFRTFLEGAGVQAVAVGSPEGANAAFDAYEVRWALIWHGRFLDAKANWEERPMKPVKPLEERVHTLPNHMPLARLATPAEVWPAAFGRRAGYVYEGYRLDPGGLPTFRYRVDGLAVEDTVRPSQDGLALRRLITIRGEGDGWYFRGAAADARPRAVIWKDGAAVFEELLPL